MFCIEKLIQLLEHEGSSTLGIINRIIIITIVKVGEKGLFGHFRKKSGKIIKTRPLSDNVLVQFVNVFGIH